MMTFGRCMALQVSSTMPPWAPTFAFDLKVDGSADHTPSLYSPEHGATDASEQQSCCRSGGGNGGSMSAGGRSQSQQLLAEALLLEHPELGVSGVKVNHAHHRVEVLAAPDATQQVCEREVLEYIFFNQIVSCRKGWLSASHPGLWTASPRQGIKAAISTILVQLGWHLQPEAPRVRHTARFRVTGMTCASCVAAVEAQVGRLPGVESVSVNLLDQSLKVSNSALAETSVC